MKFKISTLKILFFASIFGALVILVATPTLVQDGFSIFTEETIESLIIVTATVFALLIQSWYQREILKRSKVINDISVHVGGMNRQIDTLSAVFSRLEKVPATQNEVRTAFFSCTKELLNVFDGDWVLIRAVDVQSGRTITEAFAVREGKIEQFPQVSNKRLLHEPYREIWRSVSSNQRDAQVGVFCVIPQTSISPTQETTISIVVNVLSLFFPLTYSLKNS